MKQAKKKNVPTLRLQNTNSALFFHSTTSLFRCWGLYVSAFFPVLCVFLAGTSSAGNVRVVPLTGGAVDTFVRRAANLSTTRAAPTTAEAPTEALRRYSERYFNSKRFIESDTGAIGRKRLLYVYGEGWQRSIWLLLLVLLK